jgi:Tol biopolymer transport system component
MSGRFLAGLLVLLLLAACGSAPPPAFTIRNLALSAHGDIVAFEVHRRPMAAVLGELDVRTGAIRIIPPPAGRELVTPSFSPDGASLLAALQCYDECATNAARVDIVQIDRRSGSSVSLTTSDGYRTQPVMAPDQRSVVYVHGHACRLPRGLRGCIEGIRTLDLSTRVERDFGTPSSTRFLYIGKPSFVGRDQIVFDALRPDERQQPDALAALKARTSHSPLTQFFGYRLGENEIPRLLPEVASAKEEMAFVSASADGGRLIFRDGSAIWLSERGNLRRLTSRYFITGAALSADGRIAAMLENTTARGTLHLIDVATGRDHSIPLWQRLEKEFPSLTISSPPR